MLRIDGKAIAAEIREEIRREALELTGKTGIRPGLCVILVGDDPASRVYVKNKERACIAAGFLSKVIRLSADTTQEELLKIIDEINNDSAYHGLLVQLPLPKHIDEKRVIEAIAPEKDVDGFHPYNVGALVSGLDAPVACTPKGCIELLKRANVPMSGKHAVVVGRSNIVGKPMSLLLLRENCTVTVCHSKTEDLPSITRQADILVAAVGRANFITADMVKPGVAVIDVGINRMPDGSLAGDVDYEAVCEKAGAITPVPGGVGPMTIAMLLKNTLEQAKKHG